MNAHRPRAVSLLAALAALIAHDSRGGRVGTGSTTKGDEEP